MDQENEMLKVLSSLLWVVFLGFVTPFMALAQRGASFHNHEASGATSSATSGYSGMFDTQMPGKGIWNVSLPSGWVERGITEDLTLGVNSVASTLFGVLGAQGAFLKSRYRLYGDGDYSSALTLYGGYFSSVGGGSLGAGLLGAVSNHSLFLNQRNALLVNFMYYNLSGRTGRSDSVDSAEIHLQLLALGLGYSLHFSKFVGEVNVLLPQLTLELNNAGSENKLQLGNVTDPSVMIRVLANIALGKRFLLSPGLLLVSGVGLLPLLDCTLKF